MCSDSFHQTGESSGSFPNAPVDLRPKGEVAGHCWVQVVRHCWAQVHRLVDGFQVVVWNADGSHSVSWPIICIFLRLMVSPESSQASAKQFMSHWKPLCSDGHIVCKQEVPETFHLHFEQAPCSCRKSLPGVAMWVQSQEVHCQHGFLTQAITGKVHGTEKTT